MKILIVEDEAMVALSLKFLLASHGHEIVGVADDMSTAIAHANANRPELAFVDIQLAHNASGLDVASELTSRGIMCVFLTGNSPETALSDLAIGCLTKPCSDDALMAAIHIAAILSDGSELPPPPPGLELY